MSRHADATDFGKMPIPFLLWMRMNHVEYLRRFPKQQTWKIWQRWETTLLSAMLRQCRPVEVCPDCGIFLDRHDGVCPWEVAA